MLICFYPKYSYAGTTGILYHVPISFAIEYIVVKIICQNIIFITIIIIVVIFG